jgi:YcaO-like protein with predicted kinase domain
LISVDDRTCQQLITKLQCAGLIVRVWDMTTDIPIAAFVCLILPRDNSATWHHSVSIGYGCHPSREVALARALTEAAQCRLTVISGARDDIARESYKQRQDFDLIRAFRKETSALTPTRAFSEVPTWQGKTVADDVAWELKCIRKAGVKRVIVVDLTKKHFGLSVVRVIIPGLEPIIERTYVPGQRALRAR